MSDTIFFLDTTVRADLSEDVYFTTRDRLDIAALLATLPVDVIEAGQPAKSSLEDEAVRSVAREIRGCRIGALARCVPREIEVAAAALERAEEARLHVYTAISDVTHLSARDRAETLETIAAMVRKARNLAADIEFSLQNATSTDSTLLADAVRAALSGGAGTINITDAGFVLPDELALQIARLCREVPELEGAVLSFHGHDDLGVATANALAALRAGARQIEVAVNGVGDVGGNTSLQRVATVLGVRADLLGLGTRLEPPQFQPVSELVEERRHARLRDRAHYPRRSSRPHKRRT